MDGDRNGYASSKVADDVTDGNVEQIRSYTLPAPHRRQPEGRAAAPARTLTVAVLPAATSSTPPSPTPIARRTPAPTRTAAPTFAPGGACDPNYAVTASPSSSPARNGAD
jgi:hypothetical protein